MVAPARHGDAALDTVREFVERLPLNVAELDVEEAIIGAQVRAQIGPRLRLPDALVIATAIT
jgi:hypothetical protein